MYINTIRQLTAQLGVGPLIHRFAMPFTTFFTVIPLGVYMPIIMSMKEVTIRHFTIRQSTGASTRIIVSNNSGSSSSSSTTTTTTASASSSSTTTTSATTHPPT